MPWLRRIAISLGVVLLTATFVILSFPYDRIAAALSTRSQAWTGLTLEIDEISPTMSWAGLGLEVRGARVTSLDADPLALSSLFMRPSWTPGWLLGDPRIFVEIEGDGLGRLEGEVGLGGGGSWKIRLDDIQVDVLPLQLLVPGLSMEGRLSGDLDLAFDDLNRPQGTINVVFLEGTLMAPGLPIPLPFERLVSNIEFGEEHLAEVRELSVRGPVLDANLHGTIEPAQRRGSEPLALAMEIERVSPMLQPFLHGLDIPLARRGPTRLTITGTLERPTFR